MEFPLKMWQWSKKKKGASPPLVKTVNLPHQALDEDLMLIHSWKNTHHFIKNTKKKIHLLTPDDHTSDTGIRFPISIILLTCVFAAETDPTSNTNLVSEPIWLEYFAFQWLTDPISDTTVSVRFDTYVSELWTLVAACVDPTCDTNLGSNCLLL